MIIKKPAKTTNNAIAYIRVSSQRQMDEGVSIAAQTRRIKEYARFKSPQLNIKVATMLWVIEKIL